MRVPEPDFPSSAGRPFRAPDPGLLERRAELAATAQGLAGDDRVELDWLRKEVACAVR